MIKSLRKKHLQIWILCAVLVPSGIISAVLARPEFLKDKLLQPSATAALPVIVKSVDKENYTINIRKSTDNTQLQLEWINKKILTYPTATIYQTTNNSNNVDDGALIGRIETRGVYYFKMKQSPDNNYHFIVYDFIHNQVTDSITF